METSSYYVISIVIFVLSVTIWFYWLNNFLKSEKGEIRGTKSGASALDINAAAYSEYVTRHLGAEAVTVVDSEKGLFELTTIEPKEAPQPTRIERDLKIQYKKSIYVDKSFPLKITILAGGKTIQVTAAEKKKYEITTEKLNFDAFQSEPKISVELKFAEGDFKVNKTKKTQIMSASEDTVFQFTVTPLKAEDCILTIVFLYKDKIPLFKISEKVATDTTTIEPGQKPTTTHSEQIKMVPVTDDEKEVEIKSIDLKIKVKKLFGLNTKQINLIEKGMPIALAVGVFVYKVATNPSDVPITETAWAALPPVLTAIGIKGVDALFGEKEEEGDSE
jgi:hypothetical protein